MIFKSYFSFVIVNFNLNNLKPVKLFDNLRFYFFNICSFNNINLEIFIIF